MFAKIFPDTSSFNKYHAVYELLNGHTAQVIYFGNCLFSQIGTIPDARSKPGFNLINHPIIFKLIDVVEHKYQAQNIIAQRIKSEGVPELNKAAQHKRNMKIMCVETGIVYDNLTIAANANYISKSNLSNHLNGKVGFKTVSGKTYIRYNPA